MNAGGHGSDMAASLREGPRRRPGRRGGWCRDATDLALGYRPLVGRARRRSWCGPSCALAAGDPAHVARPRSAEIVRWRREHQPGGANAGSVFTNPPGDSAGRLIDAAGCKGLRIGTAEVSTKHANFIQADDGGSADDVWALMPEVRAGCCAHSGIDLHPETRTGRVRRRHEQRHRGPSPRRARRRPEPAERSTHGSRPRARRGRARAQPEGAAAGCVVLLGRRRPSSPAPSWLTPLAAARRRPDRGRGQPRCVSAADVEAAAGVQHGDRMTGVDTGEVAAAGRRRCRGCAPASVSREWPGTDPGHRDRATAGGRGRRRRAAIARRRHRPGARPRRRGRRRAGPPRRRAEHGRPVNGSGRRGGRCSPWPPGSPSRCARRSRRSARGDDGTA